MRVLSSDSASRHAAPVSRTARPLRSRRACLVLPGDSVRMVAKARQIPADQIVLDLEDAVAPANKVAARASVTGALTAGTWLAPTVSVRVNAVSTPWFIEDLSTIITGAGDAVATVIIPKVRGADDVLRVESMIEELEQRLGLEEHRIGLEIQVEDATGLLFLREALAASGRVEAVIFGPGDMAASLGMPSLSVGASADGSGSEWSVLLMMMLLEARHAGVQAIDGPWGRVDDLQGLSASAQRSRRLGYDGKWALHPGQVDPINTTYSVSLEDFERANELLHAYDASLQDDSRGALRLGEEMIDEASRRMALAVRSRGLAQGLSATD